MTARTTLATLISQVRGMTNAGTADYTAGGQTFWDDDRMQEVLDRHRIDVYREPLQAFPIHTAGGTPDYRDYKSQYKNFEQTSGGSAIFIVEDSIGADAGTVSWSADYGRGIVTFAANTEGLAYFLTGRSYDIYGAAAEIWRSKAGHFAEQFDFSTDNHSVSRSQKIKNAMAMADLYDKKSTGSGDNVVQMYRSDIIP